MAGRGRLFRPLQVNVFLDPVIWSVGESIIGRTLNFSQSLLVERVRSECLPNVSRLKPPFVKLGDALLEPLTGMRQSESIEDFLDESLDSVE